MKFWKFEAPDADELAACLRDQRLPRTGALSVGLKNTDAYVASAMSVGDGLILARLEGDMGKIVALGKLRAQEPAVVNWAATSQTVFPDAKGGLINWQTKSAFEISPEPAKRYGLERLVNYYVRDA